MNREDINKEFTRRDFLRSAGVASVGVGVSGLMSACSDRADLLTSSSEELVSGRKWMRVDSIIPDTGDLISLDWFSDTPEASFSTDVQMNGYAVLASGEILPLQTNIDKDDANELSLVSLGGEMYQLQLGGVAQPPGAPYEIRLVERTIPGTPVIVLAGSSLDPSTGSRVRFSITHDPLPLVLGIIGGGVAALYAACFASALAACGSSGVLKWQLNFGPGLQTSCSFECKHNQGGTP